MRVKSINQSIIVCFLATCSDFLVVQFEYARFLKIICYNFPTSSDCHHFRSLRTAFLKRLALLALADPPVALKGLLAAGAAGAPAGFPAALKLKQT